jgi:hypothetical protein
MQQKKCHWVSWWHFVFDKDTLRNYYEARFRRLKDLVAEMDLDEFTQHPYDLLHLVEENYEDAVYYNCCFMTLDYFLRYYVEFGRRYYVGTQVCFMH